MLSDKLNIGVYGDSILKGIQVNPLNKKYYVDNNIDIDLLSERYSLLIQNHASFGCTVTKGKKQLEKRLETNPACDAIIMDYGGNDCDYNWKAISEDPEGRHLPNTPIDLFAVTYCDIIDTLKARGILPILTTLPPLGAQNFFDWFCKDLDQKNVLKWLGEIKTIYYHQESYSRVVEEIARDKQVPLIDIRGDFLKAGQIDGLLCEDGTHPNTLGQKIISQSFMRFADKILLSQAV